MMKIRSIASIAALLAAASLSHAGDTCCAGNAVQVNTSDRTTSALMLGASTQNRIDVAPLLAQSPFKVGVDDVHRPGFNGMNWNGHNPGPANGAAGDCYAASYGAAGQENSVILIHAGPRHIVAINPFAPIPNFTADGQPMPAELVKNLESQRSRWLNDNGYTGGVRTFTNEMAKPKKDASAIKPRAIIELNPEAPRLKSRMQVLVTPRVPKVTGVATTGQAPTKAADAKADSATSESTKPTASAEPAVKPAMKVAIATTNSPSSR